MADQVIKVENLCRDYVVKTGFIKIKKDVVHAVSNISFNVEKGEIFGLLGSNGAGKTTIIKVLTTLLVPTSGVCTVLDFDVTNQEQNIRSCINFIFGGEQGVYRRLSAKDNLRYFSNLYRIPEHKQNQLIPELLELVGLKEKADYRVETYSKGMVQRLQIAKGLINDPKIVFMDEPTIGLDPVGAIELRKIIRRLSDDGKTVLLTTHYMQEAEELCNHIAIINHGKMIANDTIDSLKRQIDNISTIKIELKQVIPLENLSLLSGVVEVFWLDEVRHLLCIKSFEKVNNLISKIIDVIDSHNIRNIEVKTPSLEDVYIKLMEKNND